MCVCVYIFLIQFFPVEGVFQFSFRLAYFVPPIHTLPGGHRRLAGSGSGTATHAYPACEDNDTAYQIEEDKPNVTGHELNGKFMRHKLPQMVSI